MTTNLLKRLESSVESFRLTLGSLLRKVVGAIELIDAFQQTGCSAAITDYTAGLEALEAEEDDFVLPEDVKIGGKVQISLSDMDVERWKHELAVDQILLDELLASMQKITPDDDAKLQHLKNLVLNKIANPINDGNKKVLIFTAFAESDAVSQNAAIVGFELVDNTGCCISLEIEKLFPDQRFLITCKVVRQNIFINTFKELAENVVEHQKIDALWRVILID